MTKGVIEFDVLFTKYTATLLLSCTRYSITLKRPLPEPRIPTMPTGVYPDFVQGISNLLYVPAGTAVLLDIDFSSTTHFASISAFRCENSKKYTEFYH